MPRPSAAEVPRRQSPRGSLQLRTSSSDSDSSHHRPLTEQSPKLGDRRSPRGAQSYSVNQKKLGTRIAGLESQLGKAQEELKCLKEQLTSAEAAKKETQEQLQKNAKKKTVLERHPRKKSNGRNSNVSDEQNHKETDVFEVPIENEELKPQIEVLESVCENEKPTEAIELSVELSPVFVEAEKQPFDVLAYKDKEIDLLKSRMEEKEMEIEAVGHEKDSMKDQLDEVNDLLALARMKEEEASVMFIKLENDILASQEDNHNLKSKLALVEGEKDALETEMKKLRVQTEQLRKATDDAAAVLAGGVDMDGRVPGRCESMDKHFNGVIEMSGAGSVGYVGSPGIAADTDDDGYEGVRRKNSGIKMFGDLWKKKVQK